jgi:hypothetical protein
MTSARSLQIKGLCTASTTTTTPTVAIPGPLVNAPPPPPNIHASVAAGEDRLSEFANYLAGRFIKRHATLPIYRSASVICVS